MRLGNRVSHQLWRYYPQMLELTNDVAADWFLQLWATVPTPAKAKRIRGSTIAQLLKRHHIRRLDVEMVLCTLRQPAIKVAAGVAEAAVSTSAPWPLAYASSIASFATPSANSMNCAPHLASSNQRRDRATGPFSSPCRESAGLTSPRCWLKLQGLLAAGTTVPSEPSRASRR